MNYGIWDKTRGFNFQQSQYMPMRSHEIVSVFSDGKISFNKLGNYMTYNPQRTDIHIKHKSGIPTQSETQHKWNSKPLQKEKQGFLPKTIQTFKKCNSKLHPTQKPVALMEYLIKTYTNENETVLDFTIRSKTTEVACKNLNRRFIKIENDDKYFEIAKQRIENTIVEKSLFK
jgi:site-specific DNA-methyltransferase (adenine-specific)